MLAVVVLVLLLTFVHLWWLNRFRDGFPLDIDESRYLQFGMSLKDALADGGVRGFWRIWEAQQDFGPLLPLTSVPVYVILGESVLNGMATQLVFFAVLALASYGIGTRLTSRTGGALVALVVATAPAVVDFTRTYQFPVTAAAMLAASTYALLASDGLSRRDWSIAWGTLLGLTALARTMMIAFIPVQVVAALWLALGRPGGRPCGLPLAELEALARALLSVLLPLFDSRIARYQARLLQRRPQIAVVFNQRARDAMTNGACLSRRSAARHINEDVELVRSFSHLQRLSNDHAQRFVRKIRFECFPIDLKSAVAWSQINSSGRCFATPGSVVLNVCHVLNPFSYF